MVKVLDRAQRIEESKAKIVPPFHLDETLCFYSPQDNLDALRHPRLKAWFEFITERYTPRLPQAERRILLLLPCTKTKPYPLSLEHLRINQALHDAGFQPLSGTAPEPELAAALDPSFAPETANLTPLSDGYGTIVHRAVISEPIAFVPYEHVLRYEGSNSPSFAYDDPGLFENRGNAVSPWRRDFTGVSVSATRWRWGDEERRAYVAMHNEMSRLLAEVIGRIGTHYTDRIAWVAPGLTHRSFVIGRGERQAHNVPAFKRAGQNGWRWSAPTTACPRRCGSRRFRPPHNASMP